MNIKSILATTTALAGVLSLSGCLFYPPSNGSFPDPDRAWTKDGSYPNMDNLRTVAAGQTKRQVYQLIGPPHFNEPVFHVREWNYLFHLRQGDSAMVCQFQIRFDSDSRVTATRWRDQACADLVGAKTADVPDAPSSSQ
jgi:outer membrane protein assembly factor BamE